MPVGVSSSIVDAASLATAESKIAEGAHCDVSLGVSATVDNAETIDELADSARSLLISFNGLGSNVIKAATIASHFASWPADRPIVTDARNTDLASVLLLASLHNRSIHVTNVLSRDDIQLIALSKAKGLQVTCDVAVYALFFTTEMYPQATCLPSADDQKALWENLEDIDMFSIGSTPYQLAKEIGEVAAPEAGIEETLLLLLDAVNERRLTLDDIVSRLYTKPKQVFGVQSQADTQVEVEIDRPTAFVRRDYWSPLESRATVGSINRVTLKAKTVFVDGEVLSDASLGSNVSNVATVAKQAKSAGRRVSFSAATAVPRRLQASRLRRRLRRLLRSRWRCDRPCWAQAPILSRAAAASWLPLPTSRRR